MLLYELFNDVQIDCISSDGVQHSRFKMVATVNNQKFEGTGKFVFLFLFCIYKFYCYFSTALLKMSKFINYVMKISIFHLLFVCMLQCLAGPSKKLAKNAAAKAALATLCDISYSPMQMKAPEAAPIESSKKQTYELPQTFADGIGKSVFYLINYRYSLLFLACV